MIKLLVIADDFTGTLDTGVQFADIGIVTHVTTNVSYNFQTIEPLTQVLVIDAETRHLQPEEAGRVVGKITKRAMDSGVSMIYKKTDSALRGNIGSELSAQLIASDYNALFFVPAYPKLGRITRGGIHYVDGIPVVQSVFGQDPFEPVRYSNISELINSQSNVRVVNVSAHNPPIIKKDSEKTIYVFDAQTDAELSKIANIAKACKVGMFAGCAGFSKAISSLLLNESVLPHKESVQADGIVVISGSLNPITLAQINMADQSEFCRFSLTVRQKTDPEYVNTAEFNGFINEVESAYRTKKRIVIEPGDSCDVVSIDGYTQNQVRQLIADNISRIVQGILEHGIRGVYVLIGGDTFLSVMKRIGCNEVVPLREMTAGVVLSCIEYHGEKLYVISKSGGFGSEDVLLQLEQMLLPKCSG